MRASHIYLAIGTKCDYKIEDIIRDLKSYTSRQIRKYIEKNPDESRKEWVLWIACPEQSSGMKLAGSKNSNNDDFQFWQQHNYPPMRFCSKVSITFTIIQSKLCLSKMLLIGYIVVHGIMKVEND